MKFTRKGFFKSIFGGVLTAVAAPSLLKAEEKPLTVKTNGNIGLGISNPAYPLVVSGLIFQVGERQMQMAGNENGDFEIKWLDVKENESRTCIVIKKPTIDPFKTQFINDIR
jgi:phosphoribosylformylglycinamidine (FGAM) synthase-like amidotransferase family enzyme